MIKVLARTKIMGSPPLSLHPGRCWWLMLMLMLPLLLMLLLSGHGAVVSCNGYACVILPGSPKFNSSMKQALFFIPRHTMYVELVRRRSIDLISRVRSTRPHIRAHLDRRRRPWLASVKFNLVKLPLTTCLCQQPHSISSFILSPCHQKFRAPLQ